jgi:hypothetical protein
VRNASGHIVILAGAGLAAFGVSAGLNHSWRPGTQSDAPVVVTLPKQAPEPKPPVGQQRPPPTPVPASRNSLARQLQSELKRVGCYDGEVNGVWTTSTRMAMKAFTDRVNAKLPIDKPDHILLSLVQGHRQPVCGTTCPAGQTLEENGRCAPDATLTRAARPADEPEVEAAGRPNSASAVPPVAAVPPPLVSPPTELRRAPPKPEPSHDAASARAAPTPAPPQPPAPPALVSPPVERPHRNMRHAGPTPPVGIYERRRARRQARRNRQIRYVRSLLRSLQRAAGGVPLRLP